MTSVLPPDKAVVLIVEDEPFVRMMVFDLFADEGFEVLEAESADESLAIFSQRDDVSLLFTDVEMPGTLNGYALARWAFVHRPTVKTLIVSGRALRRQALHPSRCEAAGPATHGDVGRALTRSSCPRQTVFGPAAMRIPGVNTA